MSPPGDPDHLAAMREAAIFSTLSDAEAAGLLRRCRRRRLVSGESVFSPFQKADQFFVVLDGVVKIHQLSPRGDSQILHLYGRGKAFAEAAALAGGQYPAFAEALEDAVVLVVPRAELLAAIRENPELALGMMSGLAGKLREFARLIEDLSLKEVPARLAGALLAQSHRAGASTFRLEQSKRELAAQIGTVAETLSRAFARLRKAGLIDVRGNEIRLLDREALGALAEEGQM